MEKLDLRPPHEKSQYLASAIICITPENIDNAVIVKGMAYG